MVGVLDRNEVLLNGIRFPILGAMQQSVLEIFPQKVVFGNYTRDDEQVFSTYVLDNLASGLGIEYHSSPEYDKRYFYGNVDTRFPNRVTLSPKITTRGALTNVTKFVEFEGNLYAAAGDTLYLWNEGGGSWGSIRTFGADITDVLSTAQSSSTNRLYVACGDGTGTNIYYWTGFGLWTDTGGDGIYLAGNSSAVFATQSDNTINRYAAGAWTDPWHDSTDWSFKDDDYITELLVYTDLTPSSTLYAITKEGVWNLGSPSSSSSSAASHRTACMFPWHPSVGKVCVWNSHLYVPAGSALYRWDFNNETALIPVGPDLDEGLPAEHNGKISRVVGTFGYLYAFIDGDAADRYGAIIATAGAGWHMLYKYATDDVPYSAALSRANDDYYRLWFATADDTFSVSLPLTQHNPLRNTTENYEASGSLYSSWFRAKMPEKMKLATKIEIQGSGLSEDETISVYAQYDADPTWNLLGVADTDGSTEFNINWSATSAGVAFKKVRFRIDLARGADDTLTPVLEGLVFSYLFRPKALYGFNMTIDLSSNYKGRTPDQMRDELKAILDLDTGIPFFHRQDDSDTVSAMVIPARLLSQEQTGLDFRGRVPISLIQLTKVE
jgi:hypothetical protein